MNSIAFSVSVRENRISLPYALREYFGGQAKSVVVLNLPLREEPIGSLEELQSHPLPSWVPDDLIANIKSRKNKPFQVIESEKLRAMQRAAKKQARVIELLKELGSSTNEELAIQIK